MNIKVSVIIPLYYGNEYLSGLCSMLGECIEDGQLAGVDSEVIFVNDSPDEPVDISEIGALDKFCRILVNEKNMGIHYSRVRGLEESTGEYILFLDQDDLISRDYIRLQTEWIGSADVSMCGGYDGGREIHNVVSPYTELDSDKQYTNTLNFYLGMELIRKSSIPDIWIDNIVRTNSADDVFLNLLLQHSGASFNFCTEPLYCHVNTGRNTSMDYVRNIESLDEVNVILRKEGMISEDEYKWRNEWGKNWILVQDSIDIRERKERYVLDAMDLWFGKYEEGYRIDNWLAKRGISSVAIYGMALLGKHLYNQLINTDIRIESIMDNRVESYKGISCCKMGDDIADTDMIIVTVSIDSAEIMDELSYKYGIPVISIIEILSGMVRLALRD